MKIFNTLFFLFYRIVFMPFALCLVLLFIWPFNKKIQASMRLRTQKKPSRLISSQVIWIHASSGEFEYAKPIIRELKKNKPELFILVTYFSPSYAQQIEGFPGVDLAMSLPLDLPSPVSSFLNKFKPQMLLVARTDLWPEILQQTKNRNIPTLLFSTTFRPLTGFRALFKPYYKMLFNFFSDIYVVSEQDQLNILSSATQASILVSGDTRYDQVLHRLQNPKKMKSELFEIKNLPVLIAGSTWPEDENILLEASEALLKNNKLKLILAPHEPTESHLKDLTHSLQKLNLTHSLYSAATDFNKSVLIIDKIGILADLYTHADIAFVGGSFKSKVHSVMEPLSAGLPTVVGPYHLNNREALQFQDIVAHKDLTSVTTVNNSKELKNYLELRISSQEQTEVIRESIKQQVIARAHAASEVSKWIRQHLTEKPEQRGAHHEQL